MDFGGSDGGGEPRVGLCPRVQAGEMEQHSEAAGAEQDQVFAAMHGQLRETDVSGAGPRRVECRASRRPAPAPHNRMRPGLLYWRSGRANHTRPLDGEALYCQ